MTELARPKRSDAGVYLAIGAISVAHEVPGALVSIMAPTFFIKELGLDVKYLGLFALPVLVNAIKWLWAPLVDNGGSARFGRRLSWIIPAAAVVAALYAGVGAIEPNIDSLWVVISLFCLVALAFSAYEIAGDAYVIENLGAGQRGAGSATVWFGKEIGQIVGLAGILTIADMFGWRAAFFSAAALFLALNLLVMLRREQPLRPRPQQRARVSRFIREPVNRRLLALVLLVAFAAQMPAATIGPFLSSKGLTLSEIGASIGIAASLGAALSLSAAAFVIDRIGVKRMGMVMIGVGLLAAPSFLWLAQAQGPSVLAVIAAIFWGALCTAPIRMTFYAARLAWTGAAQAGTDFTLQQSVWFLGHALAMVVGGIAASMIGWFWFFVGATLLTAVALSVFVLAFDGIERETRALQGSDAE